RIGVLQRGYGLARCPDHGAAGVERWVGWGVLTANLVTIPRATAARCLRADLAPSLAGGPAPAAGWGLAAPRHEGFAPSTSPSALMSRCSTPCHSLIASPQPGLPNASTSVVRTLPAAAACLAYEAPPILPM